MSHILLHNIPMDDIVKLFMSHKFLNDDDSEVMSFAPSEQSKKIFLIQTLQHLKLSLWLMICDVLDNTKSTKHVGSQLKNGKLL